MSSRGVVRWENGAEARMCSADEPDSFRGPQQEVAWCDELASWRYPDAFDQVKLSTRLGKEQRIIVTTTPRPTPVIKKLLSDSSVAITRGSTYDNAANLGTVYLTEIEREYSGTRLGLQELYAEILEDSPGALWKREMFGRSGFYVGREILGQLDRIVVALDPAVSSNAESAETGIIVAGRTKTDLYLIEDRSGRYSPDGWAQIAVQLYNDYNASAIVGEVNQGGNLIEATIRTVDPAARFKKVFATTGKHTRAEPVAALYEQGRAHHLGTLARLEDQMVTWDPTISKRSPDRIDAAVWAATELMLQKRRFISGERSGIVKSRWQ